MIYELKTTFNYCSIFLVSYLILSKNCYILSHSYDLFHCIYQYKLCIWSLEVEQTFFQCITIYYYPIIHPILHIYDLKCFSYCMYLCERLLIGNIRHVMTIQKLNLQLVYYMWWLWYQRERDYIKSQYLCA